MKTQTTRPKGDWWEKFFTDFRPFFGIMPARTTNDQVRFIIRKLGLKRGKKFLDCPCGIGRITLPMARQGIRVTGVDFTKSYLDELAANAKRGKLRINLIHSDMRKVRFKNEFDAAANLWTSFGYFDKDAEDLRVIRSMYRALRPGGKFMLHVINRDWIITYFQATGWMEHAGIISIESREFDYAKSINRCRWRFLKDGQITEHQVGLRIYSYHELRSLFQKAGFVDIEGFGSTKEEPISRSTMMSWVIGTKPRRN